MNKWIRFVDSPLDKAFFNKIANLDELKVDII